MNIKSADLIGPALDWAASLITNPEWTNEDRWYNTIGYVDCGDLDDEPYAPSTDWAIGGPIIEREGISLVYLYVTDDTFRWIATSKPSIKKVKPKVMYGPTLLITAMRCFVESRLGDEVDVPDDLV